MYTSSFDIFSDMVKLTKKQNIDHVIFYSYRPTKRKDKTALYGLMLCSTMYNMVYNEYSDEEEESRIRMFISENNCVKLNCEIEIENNQIKLF